MSTGHIVQVIGPVVDVEFPLNGVLPEINHALIVEKATNEYSTSNSDSSQSAETVVLEVSLQLGNGVVRTIAMESTDGLQRGMRVKNTERPISVPVGEETLGRMFNVLGEAIDQKDDFDEEIRRDPIHREAPAFNELAASTSILETGIKVIDLLAPYLKGGKIGLFGGA